MKNLIYTFTICVIFIFIFHSGIAQTPNKISYQGLLTTSLGTPVPDGNYDLKFSIYNLPNGGDLKHEETISGVNLSKGTFSVILNPPSSIFNGSLFVEVTAQSGPGISSPITFSPRSELTAAPYSLAPWISSGNDVYYTNGKVGIGTSSPSEQLEINGNLNLPASTGTVGVIKSGGESFIHNYQAPSTNGCNTFIGINSGNFTMSGSPLQASWNTGVGYNSLKSLTTGYKNSAFGVEALLNTSSGHNNSAFGIQALYTNTTGFYNSAFGGYSLVSNNSGFMNSAFGYESLKGNMIGNRNSAFGVQSLSANQSGSGNSAFGSKTLSHNIEGNNNSAFGEESLYLTTGSGNTAIGYLAGSEITTGNNNIAIGSYAQVPSPTASNQVRIGNTSITYAGVQVPWTITSDKKFKDNITPSNLGLGFISKLNPVSYTRKSDEKHKIEYGLIAQEIEQVLKAEGVENSGMLTITDDGIYELRYNDLIAPLIKAIQELDAKNRELQIENKEIASRLNNLEALLKKYVEQTSKTFLNNSIGEIK